MKTYGNPLKRARSVPSSAAVGASADPLQVYRPAHRGGGAQGSAKGAWTTSASSLYKSPSSSQSSGSPSPPPSTFAAHQQRSTPSSLLRAGSLSISSPPDEPDEDDPFACCADDPFADARATQPLDELDDAPAPARPSLAKASSLSLAPTAAPMLQLSGASRAKADSVQFLLEGLAPSQCASVRSQSALQLAKLLVAPPPAATDEADAFCLLRACHGFATVADAMPDPCDIARPANEIFATLFAMLAFLACHDPTNSTFWTPRSLELVFALATSRAPGAAQPKADEAMEDSAPAPPQPLHTIRRSSKRVSQVVVPASELMQLLVQHQRDQLAAGLEDLDQTSELAKAADDAMQLHLAAVASLDYLCLTALTALSADAHCAGFLLHADSEEEHMASTLMRVVAQCRDQMQAEATPAPVPSSSRARGKKRVTTPSPDVTAQVTAAAFVLQHRLLSCLIILENCTHHDPSLFAQICAAKIDSDDERKSSPSSSPSNASPGAQLLFDVLALLAPNIQKRQALAPEDPPAVSPLSVDAHPIAPIFSILRLLVNVTNRNETGVRAINADYNTASGEKSSGLQLIFRLVSSIRWSYLSQLVGQPDMFNLLSVGLPIVVNAVEWSEASKKIVEEHCRVTMLPENDVLAASALATMPPSAPSPSPIIPSSDGTIPALEFVCLLWSFLHHQSSLLAAARDAKEAAAKQAVSLAVQQLRDERMSNGDSAEAPEEPPMVVDQQPTEEDQAEEEVSLGYRTLSSMASLLLGFFAVASPSLASRFLSSLRLSSFAPLVESIQEFLLVQSDSCTLQQEGLEATFRMVDQLKRIDVTRANSPTETAHTVEPPIKRPRLEENKPSITVAASPPTSSGSTFDQLFSQHGKGRLRSAF